MFTRRCCVLIVLCLSTPTAFGQGLLKFRPSSAANRQENPSRERSSELRLSDFRPVTGTTFLVASFDDASPSKGAAFSSSSSVGAGATRNYVFFDLTTDNSSPLLPHNDSLILSLKPLTYQAEAAEAPGQELETHQKLKLTSAVASHPGTSRADTEVLWHAVELISADTDGDGKLTLKDNQSLGIADAGGGDFVIVIPNLGHVFSETMLDTETLHIIHGDQTKQVAMRINLPARKVTSSNPLRDIGSLESEANQERRSPK